MVAGEPGAREKDFDTALLTAIAARALALRLVGPGQGIVPPFAGDGIAPADQPAIDHQSAAHAGPEYDAEQAPGAGPGAIHGLRQGEAVGIVLQPDGAPESLLQIAVEGRADDPGGIGVLDPPGGGRQGAGNADADTAAAAGLPLQSQDEIGDGFQGRPVISLGAGQAAAGQSFARFVEDNAFDLGAAQINADSHGQILPPK